MRLSTAVPLGVVLGLLVLFAAGMLKGDDTRSALAGSAAPEVAAATLGDYPTWDSSVFADGEVKIVNFFASWCPPCRLEHADLMLLAEEGVPIYGVNQRDDLSDALEFLDELGNPYRGIVVDPRGRQSLEWGVVALPETFVIDGDGVIVRRFAGPISGVMDTIIRPALSEAAR